MSVSMYDMEEVIVSFIFTLQTRFFSLFFGFTEIFFFVLQSASNFQPKVLLFDMSCLLCALFWPALICYFGTFATDRIELVADMAYDTNWYEYPVDVRKHIVLVIARAQMPVYFMGHGVVRATLEVFGKVYSTHYYELSSLVGKRINSISISNLQLFRSSCSYYLMFRTFVRMSK